MVLFGPVNAGKSTLFNALAGVDRALVDAEPGTTRDTLEARLELSGLAVTLVDTAGLREATGRIEALGIGKTREALAGADVAVLVLPPEATAEQRTAWRAEADPARLLELRGKADLSLSPRNEAGPAERWASAAEAKRKKRRGAVTMKRESVETRPSTSLGLSGFDSLLAVSGQTGQGLGALRDALAQRLGAGDASAVLASSERHLAALTQVEEALARARSALEVSTTEVVAGEVGLALESMALVTGTDASTALLDSIFARFCIGK